MFEDKIVQRAVTMILGAIYEQDFKDCSYGFRPKRSPHQALDALRKQCIEGRIGWIVDADVSAFFDSLDRGLLREIIKQRVNDGGIIQLIGKWLNAGVLEGELVSYPERGTPQGGVVSPMLANIFLHHVLEEWFEREVKPRMKGNCFLIRFADDIRDRLRAGGRCEANYGSVAEALSPFQADDPSTENPSGEIPTTTQR